MNNANVGRQVRTEATVGEEIHYKRLDVTIVVESHLGRRINTMNKND